MSIRASATIAESVARVLPLRHAVFLGSLAGAVGLATGCWSRDDLISGKACAEEGRCANGYACLVGTCVPADNVAALIAAQAPDDDVAGLTDDDVGQPGVDDDVSDDSTDDVLDDLPSDDAADDADDDAADNDAADDDAADDDTVSAGPDAADDDVTVDDAADDDTAMVAGDDDAVPTAGQPNVAAGAGGLDGGAGKADDGSGSKSADGGTLGSTGADAASPEADAGVVPEPPQEPGEPAVLHTNCDPGAFGEPESIELEGFSGVVLHPSLSADFHTLYFATEEGGGQEAIYRATRPSRGSRFYDATRLPDAINQQDTGTPFITADDQSLYFHSDRQGSGGRDLYVARRPSPEREFEGPKRLSDLASSANDHVPWVASDESWLVFVSSRNASDRDLWTAARSSGDRYSTPSRLGSINTSDDEGSPFVSADLRTIYFTRDSWDDEDIWVGTRTSTASDFGSFARVNALNSDDDDFDPALSGDNAELFFVSSRDGTKSLYRALADCP